MSRWSDADRSKHMRRRRTAGGGGTLTLLIAVLLSFSSLARPVHAQEQTAAVPLYKPSSRNPEPLDITSNAYGFSRSAPNALAIGDRAPDFRLRRAGGGELQLSEYLAGGDVVLVFYRGHW
ncbi:MAG: hypothetical protein AAGE43_02940 [Pseudomonadota bacterium]